MTNKDSIRKQFGENAESYAISKVHSQGGSLERLVQLVQPDAAWRVLDVATGAGHTAFAFAPYVAEVRATDITFEMRRQAQELARTRELHNIVVEEADAEKLPYGDQSFDLVTCRIAPHHFSDIAAFVKESARVLRVHGILAIVDNVVPDAGPGDYINAFEKLRDPSHNRCLSVDEWIALLVDHGFDIQVYETMNKEMDFEFWAKRHDENMQRYLRAMLTGSAAAAADFLKPSVTESGISFQLTEGIFIAEKI